MVIERKPEWIRKKIDLRKHSEIYNLIGDLKLNTICKETLCPNISECFHKKQATFLILGRFCTRSCQFCNITKSKPSLPDETEPERVAEAIFRLGLKFVVITSPTRDDLEDGGADFFIKTVDEIKRLNSNTKIEILVPDFKGNINSIEKISYSNADIISHNLETVERLYNIRKGADYGLSLNLLKKIKKNAPNKNTKSGIMLGLGETEDEITKLFGDLLSVECKNLSIGQYLSPSKRHYPIYEFVPVDRFERLKEIGINMGFSHIESSPYTRSSFMAHRYLPQ